MLEWPEALIAVGASQSDAASFRYTIYLSLVVGLVAVLIDAVGKYDTRDYNYTSSADFNKIRPSMLASSIAYRQSFIFYLFLRVGVFLLIGVFVPVALLQIDLESVKTSSDLAFAIVNSLSDIVQLPYWPAIWGLASAGVLDNIPFVKKLEPALRRAALTMAFVPHGVRIIKRQITLAPFTPGADFDGAHSVNRFLRSVEEDDFRKGRGSLERRWARFAAILYLLEGSNREGLKSRFIEEYSGLFIDLEDDFRNLETRMRLYRRSQRGGLGDPDLLDDVRDSLTTLPGDVDRALDKAEFLLACAIPTAQTPGRRSSDKLRTLGFQIGKSEIETFGNVFVSVVVVAVAAFFGTMLSHVVTAVASAGAGEMLVYPDPEAPESTVFSRAINILLYTTVIFGALFLITFSLGRRVAQIEAREAHSADFAEKPLVDYAIASFVGGAVATAALFTMVFLLTGAIENAVGLAIWAPRLFLLAFLAQILVYGPSSSGRGLLLRAMGLSLVDVLAAFMSAVAFFQYLEKSEAVTMGSAMYLSIIALVITPSLMFIFARLSHRQRALRLAAEPVDGPEVRGQDPKIAAVA